MPSNIGVLIPQSNAYPLMGKEFINGLRLGLGETEYKLIIESIAFGSDPKQLMNSVQKLIFQEDVLLTTGLLGHNGYWELAEFISKNEEVLLVSNLGSTKPIQTPTGVFENSLGLYDSLGDLAHYFSQNNICKIETSSCYYESGYGFTEALSSAIEKLPKVEFSGHFITPHHPREDEATQMLEYISTDNPDAIVAFHNGIFAKEHASYLVENSLQKKYPIYALPFTCDADLCKAHNAVFQDIKVISSWFVELENDTNKKFIADYTAAKGKQPTIFALLGYENGLIIADAIRHNNLPIKKAISETIIQGPRGTIQFNETANNCIYNNYLWSIKSDNKEVLTKLPKNPIQSPKQIDQENLTGWMNAYLCH
ncbi:MAG: branched-chain amino acid transport system substrate-binding protein [Crocinitomix sp.]|jgi:branched-chain amino acid transport system substrate-binding protein